MRFSSVPPHASVLRFVFREKNCCRRYWFAPWTSTPSAPEAIARSAAWAKPWITAFTSAGFSPRAPVSGSSEGATTSCLGRNSGLPLFPAWWSCVMTSAPFRLISCTRSLSDGMSVS